jgi:hypothetical protein
VQGRPERGEEHEPLHAAALGRAQQPQRGHRVQLLDRGARLVADGRGQVHHGFDPPQGVPERGRIGQVAERDLHPNPVRAEPPRIPHQAAHSLSVGH